MKTILIGILLSSAACFTNAGMVTLADFSGGESIEDFSSLDEAPATGDFSLGDLTFSESSYGTGGPGWRLLSCCSTPVPDKVLTDNAGITSMMIDFATAYSRIGLDVFFGGPSYDVSFFDASLNLLGVVSGSSNNSFFAGWESGLGIARITIVETSGENGFVGGIDNIRFENGVGNVPEPASLALLALGLVGLGILSRKKKTV